MGAQSKKIWTSSASANYFKKLSTSAGVSVGSEQEFNICDFKYESN